MKNAPILLVEDNPGDAIILREALADCKVTQELIVAEDGVQALELLLEAEGREKPLPRTPAIVLLDLKLPRINGLEVLKRLRAEPRTRRLPVVMLTSSKEEQDVAAAYDLGCNSYLYKTMDYGAFLDQVQAVCHYWLDLNVGPPQPT